VFRVKRSHVTCKGDFNMSKKRTFSVLVALVMLVMTAGQARAVLVSQFGILNLSANGGLNPNTGAVWAAGDQYRLAFVTSGTMNGTSNDPNVYNAFVTAQANANPLLAGSTWKAMVTVNLDPTTTETLSPKINAKQNTGTTDLTGGSAQGGAGVPVYAMNGTTAIARNNADIWNTWSNPFENSVGVTNASGTGNNTQRLTGLFYSPFLDQLGLQLVTPDAIHGRDVATGSNTDGNPLNPLGNTTDNTTFNRGASNANTTGRIWNRFTDATTTNRSFYAISDLLTVRESAINAVPEPATATLALLGLGGLMMRRRRDLKA